FPWPWLQQNMRVIWHHTRGVEFVPFFVKMPKCIENDGSGRRSQLVATTCTDCDCVNPPGSVEMRKVTFRVARTLGLGSIRVPRVGRCVPRRRTLLFTTP